MDRRLHRGNRDQGDLPPGRRHRIRQPDHRRGVRVARRRAPDRELPRHGRRRKGRLVCRPQCRHPQSGTGAISSAHRQVDRGRRAQHRLRLQQGQAATRSAAEIDDGSRAARMEEPLGRRSGQGGFSSHRLGPASAQGRTGHRAMADRHEDQREDLQRQHRHDEGGQRGRGRRRHHLSLLLVPRSGEHQRGQRQHRPALLQESGSRRVRQPVRRRRAQVQQEAGAGAAIPQVRHRQGRAGGARKGNVVRVPGRQWRSREFRLAAP